MRVSLFILLIFFPLLASGQDGVPYISNFSDRSDLEIQNWAVCQTRQNVMLFANRLGITSYDGNRWSTTRMPYIPFELKKHPITKTIYVGAGNNYGYLTEKTGGEITYNSLSGDSTATGVISRIYFTDSSVCFVGERTISIHDIADPSKSKRWYADRNERFTGFITTGNKFFINVEGKGLHRIDSDTLFPIVTGYLTKDAEVLFMAPNSPGKVLVGTSDNKLFLFDGIKYYPYKLSDDEFLDANMLSDGVAVTDSTYAFSTLYGGVVLANRSDGKILHLLNYQNGLPDDEIYAIGTDNNHGLWIIHGLGICRADLALPLRNFSNYPGIQGVVTTTLRYKDQLYVGTNEGLWYLDEIRSYTEVEVIQKRTVTRQPERINPQLQLNNPIEPDIRRTDEGVEKEKANTPIKNVFSKLFNRKAQAESEESSIPIISQAETEIQDKVVTEKSEKPEEERFVKRKVSTLKSIDHIFRKVEGLNTRCNEIISTDHGILVASSAGLYHVEDHSARAISANKFINSISPGGNPNRFYAAADDGIIEINYIENKWVANSGMYGINEPIYSLVTTNKDIIWASGSNIVFSFSTDNEGESVSTRTYTFQSDFPERSKLFILKDTLMLITESGLSYFSRDEGLLVPYLADKDIIDGSSRIKYLISGPDKPWINIGSGWRSLSRDIEGIERLEKLLRIFEKIVSIRIDSDGLYWITDGDSKIYMIRDFAHSNFDPVFDIYINNVKAEDELFFDLSNVVIERYNHFIVVSISAPHYIKESSTQYQWFVDGLSNEWSSWSNSPEQNIITEYGTNTIRLRARNILGSLSQEKIFNVSIKPPFTKTVWFYIIVSMGALGIFFAFMYVRESKLRHDKKILEEKVVQRTLEIELKKQEIEIQRDEILRQKEEITSSITYASRIQDAILPAQKLFRTIFREFFIIFKPRDIVSGDFYWLNEAGSRISFAVGDCTGHGVPGAIMSMLGISLLNEITDNNTKDISASSILGLLREKVIFSLNQSGIDNEANDGMDIALCILDKKRNRLEFAGAFNPLYLIREGELIEYKADRMPVGYHIKMAQFTNHEIQLKKGDSIYIFSDGYYDQFGGPIDKRFSSGRLKKMLKEISDLPMEDQKNILEKRYKDWKGHYDQVDDILFLGLRI